MTKGSAWSVLGALTLARLVMAFQFQSVAALAPQIAAQTGLGFVAIGTLSGAYLLPGVVAALFGGWAGQRFADIRIALWGLGLMALGGFAGALLAGFESQVCARLLAGVGAVALNVMLNKMAGDWFQGRDDLTIAMSVLVSSWPAGLALAGFALPSLAGITALSFAFILPAILCVVAFGLLARIWRTSPSAPSGSVSGQRLTWREIILISICGTVWALYNLAFITAISWTPLLLQERGFSPEDAARLGTVLSGLTIFSVAIGGWVVAPKGGLAYLRMRPDTVGLASLLFSAVLVALIVFGTTDEDSELVTGLALLGALIGLAAGMIMTLPIEATSSESRAIGLGLYWAIYYAVMGIGPSILGAARDMTGSAASPLLIASGLLLACIPFWGLFRVLQRRPRLDAPVTR
ncbi:MAG: MFS transporter [Pseudomonadota bacterium]